MATISTSSTSWSSARARRQWADAGLNYERAAFTFAADAICDEPDSDMIKDAWVWAKERNAYGLRAWS
eukprot:scaffold140002_cov96-Phaeocystis_antarctica.AAC.1